MQFCLSNCCPKIQCLYVGPHYRLVTYQISLHLDHKWLSNGQKLLTSDHIGNQIYTYYNNDKTIWGLQTWTLCSTDWIHLGYNKLNLITDLFLHITVLLIKHKLMTKDILSIVTNLTKALSYCIRLMNKHLVSRNAIFVNYQTLL